MLVSPTRFGKTQWARALGLHVYVANMWDLSAFDALDQDFWKSGYIIFDDIAWDSLKGSAKSWFGCQRDFSVCDKYRKKVRVPGGVPSILLSNPDQYDSEDGLRQFCNSDWGKENITVVRLVNRLY